MRKFKHINVESIDEAAAVLRENGRKARVLAGGTDLLGEMKDDILPEYPEVIVNLKSIQELDFIREEGEGLSIGALTRLEDIATDRTVNEKYPALALAAGKTASPHIREMGTIAGNICQNNRCWYYWVLDNRFYCLRKGGKECFALTGDARYHSIFGSSRIGCTPCSTECPDEVNIPEYMSKIREGKLEEAARVLLANNPIPAITGRVCPHFCESQCNRGEYDEPVSIRGVERFISSYILEHAEQMYWVPRQETGKTIAVIGSGPAGLTAAYYLRQAGHQVTVFESQKEPGGMLTYGIPAYRLPKEIVKEQIQALEKTGIKISVAVNVNKARLNELVREYDAVFVAAGAWKERAAGISGEEFLISAVGFLKKINSDDQTVPGKEVAVIGGGNVAIDAARTLLRLGAQPVIIYRRTRTEMPALEEEVAKAEQEGIRIEYLTLPVGAFTKNNKVILKCERMELGPPDESGRPRPVAIKGSEFEKEYDAVMKAIGEVPETSILPSRYLDKNGLPKFNEKSHSLGKGVFAGGDFISGPATVVAAVAAGRKAAVSIEAYLSGKEIGKSVSAAEYSKKADSFNPDFLQKTRRAEPSEIISTTKNNNLNQEETGQLDSKAIENEANRCFNCGCIAVNSSDIAPVLIALKARIVTSKKTLDAENLFAAGVDRTTVLDDDEIVTEINIPQPAAGEKTTFSKFAIRKSIDFPVVNCAAAIESEGGLVKSARICLNSVFNLPYRVFQAEEYLTGKPINEENAETAAQAVDRAAFPVTNNKYKIQIARTLVKRAILACV